MEDSQEHSDCESEDDFAQDFRKYTNEQITFNFITEKIDTFNIFNKLDEFAVLTINNRLHNDTKRIFSDLLNLIEKITDYDNSLFGVITDLKALTFTSVKSENPYVHRDSISKTSKILNKVYQNLAKCILKSQCLVDVTKELMNILHDVISALDRVDIRIESHNNCNSWESWKSFLIDEHDNVAAHLLTHRYKGTNELIAELHLQTLREAASDSICMSRRLLDFLKVVLRTSNKNSQSILKKMIYRTDNILVDYELELSKPNLDIIQLIQNSMKGISLFSAKVVKHFLFDNAATNQEEVANLKELGHYIGTTNIVSMRRYNRRIRL